MAGRIWRFVLHWIRCKSRYRVHSPFVYEFVTQVLPHKETVIGAKIEERRREFLQDRFTRIVFEDYGAGYGGKAQPVVEKTVAEVARSSARGRREGELLHRVCRHYQPKACLELGGNLGFSTMYQAAAVQGKDEGEGAVFVSVEGAKALHRIAFENFKEVGLPMRVAQETGEFSVVLDRLLNQQNLRPDYVLMDGNHRYAPTMEYFHKLLPVMPDAGMIVVDDINWSAEMRRAWKEIVAHPEVTLSIDLFFLGIIWIRRPQVKQHFRFCFRP